MKSRQARTFAVAAVAVLTPLLVGCDSGEARPASSGGGGWGGWTGSGGAPTPAVEVVEARYDALPLRERLTGTVRGAGQVAIYPESSGPITEVYVDDGTVVAAGEPLVRIRAESVRSQLDQAEAALAVARAEARAAEARLSELESQLRRTRLLAEDSLVSQESLETGQTEVAAARASLAQAEGGVRSAEAAVRQRRDAVERTVVRAPIGGVVGQRNAEVGMIADGQTPLFTIGRLDRMRVEVPVAQDLIGQIVTGQRAEIRTDADPESVMEAEISRISPFLAEGSFSAEAELDIENPAGRMIPGMFVTVDVYYGETDSTTVVPVSALYDDVASGRTGVYVAASPDSDSPDSDVMTVSDDGKGTLTEPVETRFVPVDVVAEGRQTAGVTGVRPGEWVVVIGHSLLARETEEAPVARIRASSWDRILRLQARQGPELLQELMDEHQRMAVPEELQGRSTDAAPGSRGS